MDLGVVCSYHMTEHLAKLVTLVARHNIILWYVLDVHMPAN